jgi:ADP-ribose pyrophosphatase YjhB (NUDIX family)
MIDKTGFRFCPRCAGASLVSDDGKSVRCGSCGFRYFHNMAAAVMGILVAPSGLLLTRRAADPGRGMLDLPGGFVDYGESLEDAIRREVREELGLELADPRYFGSFPNTYAFEGVTYFTEDAVFIGAVEPEPVLSLNDEVIETVIVRPDDLDVNALAFDSARAAILRYRGGAG